MTEYENLNAFSLLVHGDNFECERWGLVKDRFPCYEVFWRSYVVLLTNRINPAIPQSDPSWIRLRPDIPSRFEKLAVCHYSVFYYASRASERRIESKLHKDNANSARLAVEDVFYLLQTCAENLSFFFEAIRDIASDFGIPLDGLPEQVPKRFPFREINAYRNLLLHNPVLGRKISANETFLPNLPESVLDAEAYFAPFNFSWKAIENLPPDRFIAASTLLENIENGLLGYLDDKWRIAIKCVEKIRETDKFKTILKLNRFVPVAAPAVGTTTQPLAASGTFVIPK
jgi:hypothetical protein